MRRVQIILIVAATFMLSWWWKSEQLVLLLPIDNDEQVDTWGNNNNNTSVVKVYSQSNSSSNVAMCVIIKNETLYIDEWVDFHIALGFSPIYIYDNSVAFDLKYMPLTNSIYSWYDTREDIHEYIKLMHYPVAGVQSKAYSRCVKKDAANSTYVALTDVDEFLVLKTFDNVIDFMEYYCKEECGELSINWKMMGTSGEQHYTPLPVTKRNVHFVGYSTMKVIVRPSYVAEDPKWWHSAALKQGYLVDTTGKKRVANGQGGWKHRQANIGGTYDAAALHHYAFKSEEEIHVKLCVRGHSREVGTSQLPHCNNPKYYYYNETAQEFDDSAWKQLLRMVPKYRVYEVAS